MEDCPNYPKMYAILCGAIDDVITLLDDLPGGYYPAHLLQKALLEAEEVYLSTADDPLSRFTEENKTTEDY